MKKYSYILVIILIAILLSWGFYEQKLDKISLEKHSKYAIGTVVSIQHRKSRGDYAKYWFLVETEKYITSEKIKGKKKVEIGDKFKVRYDSMNPDNSELMFEDPIE